MNVAIESKINFVRNAFPSLFTKEDVIKILTELKDEIETNEDESNSKILAVEELKKQLKRAFYKFKFSLSDALVSRLNDDVSSVVDSSNVDFEVVNGDTIQVRDIEFVVDESYVKDLIIDEFDSEFADEFGEELENLDFFRKAECE